MRISDWSSDVCSSDLVAPRIGLPLPALRLALLDERINTFDSYAKQRFHRRFDLGLGSIARNLEHNGIVFGKKRRLFRTMRSNDHIIVAVVDGFGLPLSHCNAPPAFRLRPASAPTSHTSKCHRHWRPSRASRSPNSGSLM